VLSRDTADTFLDQQESAVGAVLRRGVRVLSDREGSLAARVEAAAASALPAPAPPDQPEFDQSINDFWYHALWAARKLRRGELWVATDTVNSALGQRIVQQLRWLAEARGDDAWHAARFVERWTTPDVRSRLAATVAPYAAESVPGALGAAGDVFSDVAREVAALRGLRYPDDVERAIRALLDRTLSDSSLDQG
jgi:aminoglycoside 6-adenylyltransferase